MLKQGRFINRKFDKMLLGCIWGCLVYGVNLMTDSIISGNVLGETSLQAVSIVYPLFSVVYFVVYFIAPGAGVLFGKLIGEFNKVESINAHVLNSLLEQTKGKDYLVTAAFNRDCFVFEK